MADGIERELSGIRKAIERLGDIVLAVAELEEPAPAPSCPKCGSSDAQDTSVMGSDRMTCADCGTSWALTEAVNG